MFRMVVEDVFVIRGRGTVATGRVESGELRVGDVVRLNDGESLKVDGIEAFRKILDHAGPGDNIGVLFRKLDRSRIGKGDVLTAATVY
jgi:translation elongation factor EF-Tu-like GTPase